MSQPNFISAHKLKSRWGVSRYEQLNWTHISWHCVSVADWSQAHHQPIWRLSSGAALVVEVGFHRADPATSAQIPNTGQDLHHRHTLQSPGFSMRLCWALLQSVVSLPPRKGAWTGRADVLSKTWRQSIFLHLLSCNRWEATSWRKML